MTRKSKSYPGLNIQFPISRLILEGSKKIETRTYPIPTEYIGKEMLIIETPGKDGEFKARIVGLVKFGPSFAYESRRDFYLDEKRHCVSPSSPWKWQSDKPKWGWPILSVKQFSKEIPAPPKRGIKFTKVVSIPLDLVSAQF